MIAIPPSAVAQSAPATGERSYDIPAGPVAAALAEFATASGVNIIYQQSLAGARHSKRLAGIFSAPTALQRLLEGTGLSARFTSPTSAIIYAAGRPPPPRSPAAAATAGTVSLRLEMAEVRAPFMIGKPDRGAFNRYALNAQREILERLKKDGGYAGRRFRIEIGVTVDRTGRIDDVTLLRQSSEPAWNERVRSLLMGETLSVPPPEGFVRPMRFEVETDRLVDSAAPDRKRSRP